MRPTKIHANPIVMPTAMPNAATAKSGRRMPRNSQMKSTVITPSESRLDRPMSALLVASSSS